jgi:hypothetical protein
VFLDAEEQEQEEWEVISDTDHDRAIRRNFQEGGATGSTQSIPFVDDAKYPASKLTTCPVCIEVKEAHRLAGCEHYLCARCAVQYVRSALGNGRQEVKAAGIRCPMHSAGCQSLISIDAARDMLLHPDSPGAKVVTTSSFAGPLRPEELEQFERLAIEASLPFGRKFHCPKCERPAVLSFTPEGNCECPYCGNEWDPKQQKGQDHATAEALRGTSKACPNCGMRITHYHGHDCHHIAPGEGCPGCKQHFCYVCLRKHGTPGHKEWHRKCTHRQTFCNATRIRDHLVLKPFPHDSRCGCPICPDCRPGKPCPQCPGSCVVCRGTLPPGGTKA